MKGQQMQNEMNGGEVLRIGEDDEWTFLGGMWRDGDDGELIPPDVGSGGFIAVAQNHEYSDFEASFRFRFRRGSNGGARLLFRLQDATRYYALDVPWCGQQNRCRHMWAGVVAADGTPLQRYLNLELIPGIAPEHERWYNVRVACSGQRIRGWIEGRPVADLEDGTYGSGRIGLMGIASIGGGPRIDFANLRVDGKRPRRSKWSGLKAPPAHWITPCRQVDPESYQSYPGIIQSKSGDLTASIPFGNPGAGEARRTVWVRSSDGGRNWSDGEPAALQVGFGGPFTRQDGTWVTVHAKEQGPPQEAFYTYESPDEGRTWKGPKPLNVEGEWPEELTLPAYPSGQPLRLRDGTILVPIYCQIEKGSYLNSKFSTNFVFRSTDDGQSWAAPVWCDRNNCAEAGRWFAAGNFSEIGLAEGADNVVVGLGRPGPWPCMWRVQSNDGGQSWEPAAFGSFPGYCSSLTGTASGAMVSVHRYPYLTANVSYDGGVTWDAGTIIDWPIWANHKALEAEPDVVLVEYMGYVSEPGQPDVRMARLRVTSEGLVVDK